MGRIKNTDKYNIKEIPVLTDYLIGSDSEDNGNTINIELAKIIELVGSVSKDSKVKLINFGNAYSSSGTVDVASYINNLVDLGNDYKKITDGELVVFQGYVTIGKRVSSYNTYLVNGFGSGEYGQGGDLELTNSDLILIETSGLGSNIFPDPSDDPNGTVYQLGELPTGDYLTAIDALPNFDIVAGSNVYFEYTQDSGRKVYGFVGESGNYGSGGSPMTDDDLVLLYDEYNSTNTSWATIPSNGSGSSSWNMKYRTVGGKLYIIGSMSVNSGGGSNNYSATLTGVTLSEQRRIPVVYLTASLAEMKDINVTISTGGVINIQTLASNFQTIYVDAEITMNTDV